MGLSFSILEALFEHLGTHMATGRLFDRFWEAFCRHFEPFGVYFQNTHGKQLFLEGLEGLKVSLWIVWGVVGCGLALGGRLFETSGCIRVAWWAFGVFLGPVILTAHSKRIGFGVPGEG